MCKLSTQRAIDTTQLIHTGSSGGFTLIELLVVIAVIGILTSIILGSVNTARDKGVDATVQMNLKGVRDQMALYYDNNGLTYADVCAADPNVANTITSSKGTVSSVLTLGGQGDGECVSTDAEWAVWVNLKSDASNAWCVDSAGMSDTVAAQDSSLVDLTVCP
jgi:prepilin-type N-terminal cleavage/methylation domain-containing protein